MKDPQTSGSEGSKNRPALLASAIRGAIEYMRGLPELVQVGIGVGAVLVATALPFVIYAYRLAIWDALVFAFGACVVMAALGLLGVVLWIVMLAIRKRRTSREVAEQAQIADQLAERRRRAEHLTAIESGNVKPVSDAVDLLLRSSEALWFHCSASVTDRKGESHSGHLYVTSLRISFVRVDCPAEIPIGHINTVSHHGNELQLIGRTAGSTHTFTVDDPELVAAHIARTVRAYHRQVDVGFEADSSRHIPQDVKTAVWERDGGRCVQCGATDYLEFDHIIPYAKGGASTVNNVQLLCRRCNLQKGASI
jgi:hypothetical protein